MVGLQSLSVPGSESTTHTHTSTHTHRAPGLLLGQPPAESRGVSPKQPPYTLPWPGEGAGTISHSPFWKAFPRPRPGLQALGLKKHGNVNKQLILRVLPKCHMLPPC